MKPPLIFKGDPDYAYASGVVRGLEPYILTKADYQKILDADENQLGLVLSELGYGGGEHNPEHALDIATDLLFATIDKLSKHKKFTDLLKLRYDFHKSSVVFKARILGREVPPLVPWGTIPTDELVAGINAFVEGGEAKLPKPIIDGLALGKKLFAAYNAVLAIDIALDKTFITHARSVLPKGEYFSRWFALYSDWLNTKSFVRIVRSGVPTKLFWEIFCDGGDIGRAVFARALEGENEQIPQAFANTEYGKRLVDVLRLVWRGKLVALDAFFSAKMRELFRYTRYCPYGLEIVWAYACMRLEEISTLRTILRAKKAQLPRETLKEVISVALE